MSVWSKRRAAVAAEEQAAVQARLDAAARAEEQALAERSDVELLAEAGVKPPEELISAEEVRAFLKQALPDRLKRRALRRLWGLNPVLANVDGLVDYGEDFTDKAMCVENMQTLYTVGKGMLEQFKEVEALVAEDASEEAPEVIAALAEAPLDDAPEVEAEPEQEAKPETPAMVQAEAQPDPHAETLADPSDADPIPPSRRRMRFSFETKETV